MKTEVRIKSFSYNDLVNIFSTALYGNSAITVWFDKEKYRHLFSEENCYEDKIAIVLLLGGEIDIIDNYAEGDDEVYGKFHLKTDFDEESGTLAYTINLKTMLEGLNSNPKSLRLLNELLVDEEGDMYTAWNILQIAVFGEEIYG